MSCSIKFYKMNEFVRTSQAGEINTEKSKQLIRELATAASFNTNSNILLDLRDTSISEFSFNNILEIALEFARFKSVFHNKIANIIPDTPSRINVAKLFKLALDVQGFEYRYFTKIEDAIEWFSDVKSLG